MLRSNNSFKLFNTNNYNKVNICNEIPNKIHLFWTGSNLPEKAGKNILSFLINLPDPSWKVYLWLTDFDAFYKSSFFKNLDNPLHSLILKNVNQLFENDIMDSLQEELIRKNKQVSVKDIEKIISQELIGLGNPAAAKDGLAPLILFSEGGYYFDLDTEVFSQITPPAEAILGFLLLNKGRIACALAAEPKHDFCVLSLYYLVKNYEELTIQKKGENNNLHKNNSFFDSQDLRNRQNKDRIRITIRTSGSIFSQACRAFMKKFPSYNSESFYEYIWFPISSFEENKLAMGVKLHLKSDGNWRDKKNYPSFDDTELNFQQFRQK